MLDKYEIASNTGAEDVSRHVWYPAFLLQVEYICGFHSHKFLRVEFDMTLLLIYLLTAIGSTPGGSSTVQYGTVHIYTQTVHRTTQSTKTIHRTTQFTNDNLLCLHGCDWIIMVFYVFGSSCCLLAVRTLKPCCLFTNTRAPSLSSRMSHLTTCQPSSGSCMPVRSL